MKNNTTWKYYFSEKQRKTFEAINDRNGRTYNPICHKYAPNGEEYTAVAQDGFPSGFDDYVLVAESEVPPNEKAGSPI